MKRMALGVALLTVFAIAVGAQGATLYWDGGTADISGNGNSQSAGGDGIWNKTIKNWDKGVSPHVAWTDGNSAVFGGTDGTVTLGTAIVVSQITSSVDGYEISGADGNTLTINTGVAVSSGILKISGVISSDTGFSIGGSGTLTLSAANIHTGPTSLLNSTLNLSNQYALQHSTLDISTEYTLVFDSIVTERAFTFGGLNGSTDIALENNAGSPEAIALTIGGNNEDTIYQGVLSAGGSLTKVGTGTVILSGSNSYTGATYVNAGTLVLYHTDGGTGSIAGSAAITVAADATLDVTQVDGGWSVGSAQILNGNGTVAGNTAVAGHVAPGSSIGTLRITGDMAISGTLDVEYDGADSLIDLLAVSGNLNISSATVDFAALNTSLAGSPYVFATYGTLTGASFAGIKDLPTGYKIDYAYNNGITTNNIALAVIPEPGTVGLVVTFFTAVLLRKRRFG